MTDLKNRDYVHALATAMADNEHGDSADETDIEWYRDLLLNAMAKVDSPHLLR